MLRTQFRTIPNILFRVNGQEHRITQITATYSNAQQPSTSSSVAIIHPVHDPKVALRAPCSCGHYRQLKNSLQKKRTWCFCILLKSLLKWSYDICFRQDVQYPVLRGKIYQVNNICLGILRSNLLIGSKQQNSCMTGVH